ncbi:FliO/MopB family protein [Gemmatimonadota bacterium]
MVFSTLRLQQYFSLFPDCPSIKFDSLSKESPLHSSGLIFSMLLGFFLLFSPADSFCLPDSAPVQDNQNNAAAAAVSGQSVDTNNSKTEKDSSSSDSAVLDSLAAAGIVESSFHQDPGSPIDWVWVFASIFIVIGLLLLFLYLLRVVIYRPPGASSPEGQFEMLRQFHLGPRKSICLVKVCDRLFLLGVTESNITRLMEVSDPEEAERMQAQLAASPKMQGRQFRDVYQGLVGRLKK